MYDSAVLSFSAEFLTGAEIRKRFPQWTVGDDVIGVYVPEGGFVDAALANSTHVQLARGYGASVIDECPVQKLQPTKDGQTIVSENDRVFFPNFKNRRVCQLPNVCRHHNGN